MNKLVRKLPFTAKLTLIGLIPFCFLVYLTIGIYKEKTSKMSLLNNYRLYIAESANINSLINSLQEERKFSFDYAMTNNMRQELLLQRPQTDSLLATLQANGDPSLTGFVEFTKLKDLSRLRNRIDSAKAQPNEVMHFYSNTIFRLNTLNTIPPANTPYLQTVYEDLAIHKILSEMVTYLGIIRSNIYNVLHTRKYMIETLVGTVGTHDVYDSYEAELLAKASIATQQQYKNTRQHTALKPTADYIDTLFKKFTFDSTLTAAQWWTLSNQGTAALHDLQRTTWNNINKKLDLLITKEETLQRQTLVVLIAALLSVIMIITYIVFITSQTLSKLRFAAEQIAEGQTGIHIPIESTDIIGSLARSIAIIDNNNQSLTHAATEIGRGNFNVEITPRSTRDQLGSAIAQMKGALQIFQDKMEQLVASRTEELARSNEDLQQFAHVASHDLKEPLRKISTFSNLLGVELNHSLPGKAGIYLQKIEDSSLRMSTMIEGVLAYSTVSMQDKPFQMVDLNEIMEGVQNDLEFLFIQKEGKINFEHLPAVTGIQPLLHQLFYNLVNNALKFSRQGIPPVIKISVSNEDFEAGEMDGEKMVNTKYVHLVFEDNGIGFDQAYAKNLFNVFFRLHSKDKYEGTGLGLALCKKIVSRHYGQIYAEGKEGAGACFHILLPLS